MLDEMFGMNNKSTIIIVAIVVSVVVPLFGWTIITIESRIDEQTKFFATADIITTKVQSVHWMDASKYCVVHIDGKDYIAGSNYHAVSYHAVSSSLDPCTYNTGDTVQVKILPNTEIAITGPFT